MDDGAGIVASVPVPASRPVWADRARELLRQDFWTAADLAALELRELPTAKFRIHEWLKRHGVLADEVSDNGGKTLCYNLYSMPSALRRAIALRLVPYVFDGDEPGAAEDEARVADLRALEGLPPGQAMRAKARAAVVHGWRRWSGASGMVGARGMQRFADLWAADAVGAPAWLREEVPSFHAKTLAIWGRQLAGEGGLRALAGAYKPRVALLDQEEAWAAEALTILAAQPTIAAARIHEIIAGTASDEGRKPPSCRAVQRWLANWIERNKLTHAILRNPDAARSRFMPAFGDAGASATGLNAVWEMDTTPADLATTDGRRWTIYGIIDVWSRDAVLRLAETTSGHNGRLVFRDALLHLGVPQVLRTDNGSDLRNRDTEALLGALGIDLPFMPVHRPDLKPFIERFLQLVNYDLVPLLPGYVGHNVADAQAIRSRQSLSERLAKRGETLWTGLTSQQLQSFLETWLQGYRKRVHGSLRMSPEARRATYVGPIRRIEDRRALDVLLAPLAGEDGWRTVSKKGLRADNGHYVAPELGDMVGQRVLCRHDPADAGRLYVFDERGAFICAAEDWRLTGADPQELAMAAKAAYAEAKTEAKVLRTKARRVDLGQVATELANRRAAQTTNVVPLRQPAEAHSTPALREHGKAARADEFRPASARSEAEVRRAEFFAARAEQQLQQATTLSKRAQAEKRIAEGLALMEAIAAGQDVPADRRAWFAEYRKLGEFRQALRDRGINPDTGKALKV